MAGFSLTSTAFADEGTILGEDDPGVGSAATCSGTPQTDELHERHTYPCPSATSSAQPTLAPSKPADPI